MVDAVRGDSLERCTGESSSITCGTYNQKLGEMRKLSERNTWNGVEAAYQEILALRNVQIEAEVYWIAAQAARAQGNALEVYNRIQLVLKNPGDYRQKAQDWLNDLGTKYGCVEISLPKKGSHTLTPSTNPFAPDQRSAITFAQTQLAETGGFKGLLPLLGEDQSYALNLSDGSPVSIILMENLTGRGCENIFKIRPSSARELAAAAGERVGVPSPASEKKLSLWASLQGGWGFLNRVNVEQQIHGLSIVGDVTAQLKPWSLPASLRVGAGAGWTQRDSKTENLPSVPFYQTFGVDFNDHFGSLQFTLGSTLGVVQNLALNGNLSVGSGGINMTEPAYKPISLVWGGRLMLGVADGRLSGVAEYLQGSTEVRGLLPEYGNVVGTAGQSVNRQFTVGGAYRFR
jgi:hypothetical protein